MKSYVILSVVSVAAIIVGGYGIIAQADMALASQLYQGKSGNITKASNNSAAIETDIIPTINIAKNIKDQKMKNTTSNNENSMDPVIMSIIAQFKTQTWDRREPAKKLLPLLKKDTSIQKIETILGEPDSIVWDYTLFYSSTLIIDFDNAGKAKKITSDLSDEVIYVKPYVESEKNPEIIGAISDFKGQPFNRQEPAKKLLPLLNEGMSTKEIEVMLGKPDGRLWVYNLLHSSSTLSISITSTDKLEDIIITDLNEE